MNISSSPPHDKTFTQRKIILNRKGLHARASAKFVQLAEQYDAQLNVTKDGATVGATSIMGLMMLAASPGTTITLTAKGRDARQALEALCSLIDSGFYEDTDGPARPES